MNTEMPTTTLPVFLDLWREFQATQFGDIDLSITTHRGQPVALVINSFRREKFGPDQFAELTTRVLSMMKEMHEKKETGSLSFTVTFDQGHGKELVNQFYDKKKYVIPLQTDDTSGISK